MHLNKDCLTPVLDEYGYKRTAWVLCQHLARAQSGMGVSAMPTSSGRSAPSPKTSTTTATLLSEAIRLCWMALSALPQGSAGTMNLFGAEHCVGDRAGKDYTGKVLVLSPRRRCRAVMSQENQLWYARSGFGCEPHSSGRRSLCQTRLGRRKQPDGTGVDFIGVLDDKFLPDWARKKLEELDDTGTDGRPPLWAGVRNLK